MTTSSSVRATVASLWPGRSRPVVPAVLGAGCISSSAITVQLAHAAPGTTGFLRCALALPGLLALAYWEKRRTGPRRSRERLGAAVAGAFLGVDLVLWTHAIYDVGAGVATVLGNLQVLFVAGIAWLAFGERPGLKFLLALPVVIVGIVLVAGLLGQPSFGHHALAGVVYGVATSMAYAVFILVLRHNTGSAAHIAGPVAEATVGAATAALLFGLALGEVNFHMSLRSWGWLLALALASQTVGWLLITSALPHLTASMSSLLLLLQPAASLVLAAIVLGQRPTVVQVAGAVLVCGGVLFAARARGGATEHEPGPAPA